MTERFRFGSLVVLRGAGRAPEDRDVGIIAEMRRSDCRVLYLRPRRSQWAALRDLSPAPASLDECGLESEVSGLLSILGASEMEFGMPEDGCARLTASHGPITPEALDEVRSRLGMRLKACVVRPQGMHRIQTVLEFTVPRDAGQGPR